MVGIGDIWKWAMYEISSGRAISLLVLVLKWESRSALTRLWGSANRDCTSRNPLSPGRLHSKKSLMTSHPTNIQYATFEPFDPQSHQRVTVLLINSFVILST